MESAQNLHKSLNKPQNNTWEKEFDITSEQVRLRIEKNNIDTLAVSFLPLSKKWIHVLTGGDKKNAEGFGSEINQLEKTEATEILDFLKNSYKRMKSVRENKNEYDNVSFQNHLSLSVIDLREASPKIKGFKEKYPESEDIKKIEIFVEDFKELTSPGYKKKKEQLETLEINRKGIAPTINDIGLQQEIKNIVLNIFKPKKVKRVKKEIPYLIRQLEESRKAISATQTYEKLYPSQPGNMATKIEGKTKLDNYQYYRTQLSKIHSKLLLLKKEYPHNKNIITLEKEYSKAQEILDPEYNSIRKAEEMLNKKLNAYYKIRIPTQKAEKQLLSEVNRVERILDKLKKEFKKDINIFATKQIVVINDAEPMILSNDLSTTHIFKNGQDALDYISKHIEEIDYVISDYNIGGKVNGDVIASNIKEIDSRIPVFSSTAGGHIKNENLYHMNYVGYINPSELYSSEGNYLNAIIDYLDYLKYELGKMQSGEQSSLAYTNKEYNSI